MGTIARVNNLRIAPRKMQILADLVRGKSIEEALAILKFTPKRGAPILSKLLNSARANVESDENLSLNPERLYVKEIYVDQGMMLKRWQPAPMGRALRIHKRTSKVTVVLDEY